MIDAPQRRSQAHMLRTTDIDSIAAESVRAASLDAAREAYEDAGIRGLCADGRWEAALAAIRQFLVPELVHMLRTLNRSDVTLDQKFVLHGLIRDDARPFIQVAPGHATARARTA